MEDLCANHLRSKTCPNHEKCPNAHSYSDLSNLDNWVVFDAPGLEMLDFLAYKYFSHHYYKVHVLPGVGPIVRFATPEDANTVVSEYSQYYNPTPLRVFHEKGGIPAVLSVDAVASIPAVASSVSFAAPPPNGDGEVVENCGADIAPATSLPRVSSVTAMGSRQASVNDFTQVSPVPASPALRQGAPVLPYASSNKEPGTPMSFPGTPDLRFLVGSEGTPGTPTLPLPRTRIPGGHARDHHRLRMHPSQVCADAMASFSNNSFASDFSVESEQSIDGLSQSMSSLNHGYGGHHSFHPNGAGFGVGLGGGIADPMMYGRSMPIPAGFSPHHPSGAQCTCMHRFGGASTSPLEGGGSALNNSPPSMCGVPSYPPSLGAYGGMPSMQFLNSTNIQGSFSSSRGSGCGTPTPTTPLTPLYGNSPARPVQHRSVTNAKNGSEFANSPKKPRARQGFGHGHSQPFAESYTDKVLQILRENGNTPKHLNYQLGWETMKILWNVRREDLDEPVLQYLCSRSALQQEQILLSFAAIDLSSVNNLSAYLNCLIKEHEGSNQVCLHFLAGLCDSPQKCGYVHPINTLGWTALQSKWGITYQTLDYAVLNYLCKKPIEQQDTILVWLSEMNLSEVNNMSAYLSSAIQKFDSQSIIPHHRHSHTGNGFADADKFKGKRPQKLWPRIRQQEGSNPGTPTNGNCNNMRNSPSTPNSGLRPGRIYMAA